MKFGVWVKQFVECSDRSKNKYRTSYMYVNNGKRLFRCLSLLRFCVN